MKKMTKYLCLALAAAVLLALPLSRGTARADGEAAGGITYVLDECDTTDNFTNIRSIDRSNFVTGEGCVYNQGAVPTISAIFRDIDHAKLPPFNTAYLEMYIWIEDVAKVQEGQIELNSTGAFDIYERMFVISRATIELDSGWNYVSLKLSDSNESDAGRSFDYSKLMGMRIYAVSKPNMTNAIRLDHIALTDTPQLDAVKKDDIHPQAKINPVIDKVVDESVVNRSATGYLIWLTVAGAAAVGFGTGALLLLLQRKKGGSL
ncbi:hypothetical protein FACS1894211_07190 [Clostridia bacterium]|nr:hypothetical protein FACS1894211_07190 [Clostridia bacterium]